MIPLDQYKFIFAMGAPGSRWSGVLRTIQLRFADINTSDDRPERTYNRQVWNIKTSQMIDVGWHTGAYWGPYHEFGQGFDNIEKNYTKETFIQECIKPFTNTNGTMIIKSHWFSYNIEILREWFPETKFIAVKFGSNLDTFAWWHFVGGWNITYPYYTWYKDNETLFEKIQLENKLIDKYFNCKENTPINKVGKLLGLDLTLRSVEEICKIDNKFKEQKKNTDITIDHCLQIFNNAAKKCAIGVI